MALLVLPLGGWLIVMMKSVDGLGPVRLSDKGSFDTKQL